MICLREEYNTVRHNSSHKLLPVYIQCVTAFKMQKEANTAAGKKKPERKRTRWDSEREDAEQYASNHDMSITTSNLLEKISKKPRKDKNNL